MRPRTHLKHLLQTLRPRRTIHPPTTPHSNSTGTASNPKDRAPAHEINRKSLNSPQLRPKEQAPRAKKAPSPTDKVPNPQPKQHRPKLHKIQISEPTEQIGRETAPHKRLRSPNRGLTFHSFPTTFLKGTTGKLTRPPRDANIKKTRRFFPRRVTASKGPEFPEHTTHLLPPKNDLPNSLDNQSTNNQNHRISSPKGQNIRPLNKRA